MSRFVRPSKYRHVFGHPAKKEMSYENVKVSNSAWDTNLIAANGSYISLNWQASGGGAFAIIPLNRPGKLNDIYPLCRGHTAPVLDTAFSPFDDHLVASASEDGTVGLWRIHDNDFHQLDWTDKEREKNGGVRDFQPWARFSAGGRKVGQVAFHPTASNVLAVATADHVVKLFDVTHADSAATSPSISLRGFGDSIQSFDWDWTGTTLIATCRDRKIRTFDPRQGEAPVQVADSHGGVKGARVVWCGDSQRAISTGFSKMSDRQLFLWDTTNLAAGPLRSLTLDTSSGIVMPFWSDNGIVFLAGKGDGNIRYYELENDELHFLTETKSSEPQRGLTFVARRFLNTDDNEIAKAYKVTGSMVQPLSFQVPRRAESFQADIFPPAPSDVPSLTAEEFFKGKRAARNLVDLESGKGLAGGSVRAPAPASAAAASAAAGGATPRAASPVKPTAGVSSSVASMLGSHEGTARSEVKSTVAALREESVAVAPATKVANGNKAEASSSVSGAQMRQLEEEVEKLRALLQEQNTRLRELELENEQWVFAVPLRLPPFSPPFRLSWNSGNSKRSFWDSFLGGWIITSLLRLRLVLGQGTGWDDNADMWGFFWVSAGSRRTRRERGKRCSRLSRFRRARGWVQKRAGAELHSYPLFGGAGTGKEVGRVE
ncbi:Coronin-like protein crn1 [Thecaphora frezii]